MPDLKSTDDGKKFIRINNEKITHTSCIRNAYINPFEDVTMHPSLSRIFPIYMKKINVKCRVLINKLNVKKETKNSKDHGIERHN